MSDIRIKMAKDLRDMSDMVGDLHWMAAKAVEDLTKKDGEIAKRDETIARLEPQLNRAIQANYDLREELAACRVSVENCEVFRAELATIKEQEPIGWYTEDHLDDKSATTYSKELADRWVAKGWPVSPLYAAPVSEAKAQGVVQWPEADEIMQMAFEEGQPADDASGYCFELEEFDLFIERLMSEVARLNAAPAAPAADAGLVAVEWAKDAEEWGPALNEAGWLFLSELNEDPQKSALIFNNCKGPLRAAIMKYAEIVTAYCAKGVV